MFYSVQIYMKTTSILDRKILRFNAGNSHAFCEKATSLILSLYFLLFYYLVNCCLLIMFHSVQLHIKKFTMHFCKCNSKQLVGGQASKYQS